MLLVSLVLAYLVVFWGSLWLLFRSRRKRDSFVGRHRVWLWLFVAVEIIYALRSPACVYLPRAPGPLAVERVILGTDGSGRLYWLEAKSKLSFAWGTRWWFHVGHAPDAGVEFIPPLRYARRYDPATLQDESAWELVASDGSKRRYPTEPVGTPRWWSFRVPDLVRRDGSVLSWRSGLRLLGANDVAWRLLVELPYEGSRLKAASMMPNDHTLEVYQNEAVFNDSRGHKRALTFVERDTEGQQVRRVPLSLPEDPNLTTTEHTLRLSLADDKVLLFETWGAGQGRLYVLPIDLTQAQRVSEFELVLGEHETVSLAASEDGELFTTGQAIFHSNGEKVQDLDPPLASCFWVGHTLHGVEKYPFFVSRDFKRLYGFNGFLAVARGDFPDARQRQRKFARYAEAWRKGRWIFGGLDEANRQDEIRTVVVP